MSKQGRVSIIVVLSVAGVLFAGLLGAVSTVSARWYVRTDYTSIYQERVCRNGMIFAGMWPHGVYSDTTEPAWFDWETDPYGNTWDSKTFGVNNGQPLTVTSARSGPRKSDPIDGVKFKSNMWIVRWDDLYPDLTIGDDIPAGEMVTVTLSFYSDQEWAHDDAFYFTAGGGWGYGGVTGCVIEDHLPAPSMYELCSISEPDAEANPLIEFPADIHVADLDVEVRVTDILSEPLSANLSGPDGRQVNLITGYTAPYGSLGRIFDDEGYDDYRGGGYSLPEEPLTAFDGASAAGQWQLALTNVNGQPYSATLDSWCLHVSGYHTARFAAAEFETAENVGTADIMVELSEPSTVTTTVDYATLPGGDSNQEPISGTLTFAPGELSKSFTVPIVDDTVHEADEALQLVLGNPGNQYGLGDPAQASLTILDNDPVLNLIYLPSFGTGSSAPATDVIDNPGFESGPVDWLEYSWLGYPLISYADELPVTPHGGSWAAWLGGDDFEISYVEQTITVPTTDPFLSYWHYIISSDDCGYDFGGVVVDDMTVVEVYDLCQATNTGGWVQRTVDLSAYSGQTIALQIRAETDVSLVSNLFVDDVSFQAANAAVAPNETSPLTDAQPAIVEKSALTPPATVAPALPDVQRLVRDAARAPGMNNE